MMQMIVSRSKSNQESGNYPYSPLKDGPLLRASFCALRIPSISKVEVLNEPVSRNR